MSELNTSSSWGRDSKNGEIKLKDVINDLEDEDSHAQIGEKRDSIINLIDEIDIPLQGPLRTADARLEKRGLPAAKKKKFDEKMEKD